MVNKIKEFQMKTALVLTALLTTVSFQSFAGLQVSNKKSPTKESKTIATLQAEIADFKIELQKSCGSTGMKESELQEILDRDQKSPFSKLPVCKAELRSAMNSACNLALETLAKAQAFLNPENIAKLKSQTSKIHEVSLETGTTIQMNILKMLSNAQVKWDRQIRAKQSLSPCPDIYDQQTSVATALDSFIQFSSKWVTNFELVADDSSTPQNRVKTLPHAATEGAP
jgi:hypothetical protein